MSATIAPAQDGPAHVEVVAKPKPKFSKKVALIALSAVAVVISAVAVVLALMAGSDSEPSSPMMPPPPLMPPPSPPPSSVVSFDVVASGSVSDYGDTEKAAIAQAVATRTGVAASDVTVAVVAGSVTITVSITAPDTAISDGSLVASLATEFLDTTSASTFLGVTVETAPTTFSTTVSTSSSSFASYVPPPLLPPSPSPPPVPPMSPPSPPPPSPPPPGAFAQYQALSTANTAGAVYSAMSLSGDAADGDLEQMLYYVVSDMSAAWGYHHLIQGECCTWQSSCCPSSYALPVLLYYRVGQAPTAKLDFNTQLASSLPSGYPTCCSSGDSSGINGNGQVFYMRVMYDEVSPTHRLSVIFHEYLHVAQIKKCQDVGASNDSPTFSLWLWEGAAMATENLYLDYYFKATGDTADTTGSEYEYYYDNLFGEYSHHAVKWTIDDYLAGSWAMSSALESYAGGTSNYHAEGTAFLYLCSRTSYRYAMVEFITSGDCDLARVSGSKDATFAATFGAGSSFGTPWTNLADFYADFNAWLATNPSPSSLRPTAAQINEVFSHTTICSDLCATANNGVCDSSCLYGSDCTDCGPTTKPAVFPVTLRAPDFGSGRRLAPQTTGLREASMPIVHPSDAASCANLDL